jgi:hypothetical protein
MLKQRLRQVGEDVVVTIPKEDLERLGLTPGDWVAFEPMKIEDVERGGLSPDFQALVDSFWDRPGFQEGLKYLKDR